MQVTIKDIAKEANVSRGTVDRALNDRGGVNPDVAARIKSIASELGLSGEEVRAYFNGEGTADYHMEAGPDGGIVDFTNTRILEVALRKAWEVQNAL